MKLQFYTRESLVVKPKDTYTIGGVFITGVLSKRYNIACDKNFTNCFNRGKCYKHSLSSISHFCVCDYPFTGENCQFINSNFCKNTACPPNQCYYNVTAPKKYSCNCSSIRGSISTLDNDGNSICKDINECKSNPCHHGKCINKNGYFLCECDENWNGLLCDRII
ncbi:hypothetical protein A3Q56_02061 [Intoshia linei]|uniref:EGF-like domain-containing protein n=1 Tax=Intoshia linei TaxID=1819745 RepID=A0A177B964_9BILA|nr:hypothetical protein A3Q56_02061 [Intoshia linei]